MRSPPFPEVILMTAFTVGSVQSLSYTTHTWQCLLAVPLKLQKFLCKLRYRFVQRYNLDCDYHEMCKINLTHRASVVARMTKDCVLSSCIGVRSKIRHCLPNQVSTSGDPAFHPLRILWGELGQRRVLLNLGDLNATHKGQSCQKLVIGNWNINSHTGKEHDWSRKPQQFDISSTMRLGCTV